MRRFCVFTLDNPPGLWYYTPCIVAGDCDVHFGEMSEWFKEAVLKTAEGQTSVGSNPTLSAIYKSELAYITLLWSNTQEVEEAPLLRA